MLKKVWITKNCERLYSITLESSDPELPINAACMKFPNLPTPQHPLRHTTNIGLLNIDDLLDIRNAIDEFLHK